MTPDFRILSRTPTTLECAYCGDHATARFAASKLEGRFHRSGSAYVQHILDANLVLFGGRGEALAAGFEPARREGEGGEPE